MREGSIGSSSQLRRVALCLEHVETVPSHLHCRGGAVSLALQEATQEAQCVEQQS
jgi:hypothetical protein